MLMLAALAAVPFQARVSDSLMPTGHLLDPAGKQLVINSRPVDLVLSPDGKFAIVKDNQGVKVVKTDDWTLANQYGLKNGASMHGLLCTPAGVIYDSDAHSEIHVGQIGADGSIEWKTDVSVPKPSIGGESYPCGMATLTGDRLAVCASRANALDIVEKDGSTSATIDVDPCPFDVAIAPDGKTAWVTCWGRKPGRHSAMSSGTAVDVDDRTVATGGNIDVVDLQTNKVVARIAAGLQPSQIAVNEKLAYVANANSDTVGVYDLAKRRLVTEALVKPDLKLPFGSAPNALAVSPSRGELYVACGGNNAVAVLTLGDNPAVKGFIPTNWYPGAVAVSKSKLYVASIKGTGSRNAKDPDKHSVYEFSGSVGAIDLPDATTLAADTAKVSQLAMAPQILDAYVRTNLISGTPEPVPQDLGGPSAIQHVVYVIKENRTYDQVLGDIGKGESDSSLTIYGADTTPNEHALAGQFVLLDNFYCNGVNSADGHSWATEGIASSYLERSFGGFTRSYPFGGDDALNSASSGFIWDAALAAGRSFRNYGEGDYAGLEKAMSWKQLYDATLAGATYEFKQSIANDRLRRYSCRNYPGWNLGITDQYRADVFLQELAGFEKKNSMPNFSIVYLDQDHTAGLTPGMPTPKAMVADNDYALGRIVDGISHSKFWGTTAIFVVEDDAQDGWDHVDGHRSTCFVVSPYCRRGALVSTFYNQTSVVHTMLQILGAPPLNQMDAMSPLMTDCFKAVPDLTPYTAKPPIIPLDTLNVAKKATALQRRLMAKSKLLDLTKPDASDEDLLNRMQWVSVKGSRPYPGR
ncbi:MAG TPA: alkaline phosphatase family protein [Fimbriimonadaceae bacterium]|nr:alkaline phosphatase family protein [Fimbriimonadaceae bacterium]